MVVLLVGTAVVSAWVAARSIEHRAMLARMDWQDRVSQRSGV